MKEHKPHESLVIEELLRELEELRELDQRRNAHAPGSADHDAATLEVDLRSRRLMDRFRDLKDGGSRASASAPPNADWTMPVDVRRGMLRHRVSLLN